MNKDLLIKLTKLANHNPNDHEANSAARRVCKMLEESNWSLTDTTPPNQKTNREYRNPPGYYEDWYRKWTRYRYWDTYTPPEWNDVHRSTEPEFKSGYYSKKEYSTKKEEYYEKVYDDVFNYTSPKENAKKEQRNLKCKICGKFKLTKFVGAEELFECNNCQWTAYTREKAEKR